MFSFHDLAVPIVAAPMAGGPSTPELVAAVARAGGLGFLAAGYRLADEVAAQIRAVRTAGAEAFGVNVFVPANPGPGVAAVGAYRQALRPMADRYGVTLPEPVPDDDGWRTKIALLVDDPVPVVSFTFGLPGADVVEALHRAGSALVATVTGADEARAAADRGMDALVVQGPLAGGHRATFDVAAPAPGQKLADLTAEVSRAGTLPWLAAGGLMTAVDVAAVITHGAVAAQLGTAFLRCPEAGTSAVHRAALADPRFEETVVTRCFSGRWARGLRNDFVERYDTLAPAAYPAVNQVTGPLRRAAAAAGHAEHTHLWAGAGWRRGRDLPVKELIAHLAPH